MSTPSFVAHIAESLQGNSLQDVSSRKHSYPLEQESSEQSENVESFCWAPNISSCAKYSEVKNFENHNFYFTNKVLNKFWLYLFLFVVNWTIFLKKLKENLGITE